MFNQSVEFPSTPSISSLLTYPPNLFGTRIRVQRLGAKTDPRRRPILVWRPYKTPSPPTSPPAPRRDWRGTRPYRRRVGVPHLAAAAADGVYPLTVAAAGYPRHVVAGLTVAGPHRRRRRRRFTSPREYDRALYSALNDLHPDYPRCRLRKIPHRRLRTARR